MKEAFNSTDKYLSFNRYKTPNNRSLQRDNSETISSVSKVKSKSITNDKKTITNNSTSNNKNTFNTQKSKVNFAKKQPSMTTEMTKGKEPTSAIKSTFLSFINVKNIKSTRKVELKTAAIKPDNRPKSMNVLRSTTGKNQLFSLNNL